MTRESPEPAHCFRLEGGAPTLSTEVQLGKKPGSGWHARCRSAPWGPWPDPWTPGGWEGGGHLIRSRHAGIYIFTQGGEKDGGKRRNGLNPLISMIRFIYVGPTRKEEPPTNPNPWGMGGREERNPGHIRNEGEDVFTRGWEKDGGA